MDNILMKNPKVNQTLNLVVDKWQDFLAEELFISKLRLYKSTLFFSNQSSTNKEGYL
jgi:hypothetical protein